ncbi:MAG: hypothetical protein H7Y18_11545, partial [Clostridiaceae bacterium]|nr:hypothetical protein [Clostridiaceae bacterium]
MNDTNAQSILKLFIGVLIVITGIWLIMTLFTHTGFNMGTTVGHNYEGGHMI